MRNASAHLPSADDTDTLNHMDCPKEVGR